MELNVAQLLAIEYAIAVVGLFLGYKCFSLKKDNMNYFMRFVVVVNLFLLFNIPVRYIELHLVSCNRMLVFVLYALSNVLMNFVAAYWNVFILKQINSSLVDSTMKIHLWMLPAACSIPLCIINYWTGWLYVIDENSWYSRGSVFVLQSCSAYGYILALIIVCVSHIIRDKDKVYAQKCLITIVPGTAGAALQITFGGSYVMLGVLLTGWMMYIEICLDRQKAYELSDAVCSINNELIHSNDKIAQNMRTILALSDIYYALYEADFVHDTFIEIKALDYIREFCRKYTSLKECMSHIASEMYAAGYVGLMEVFFNPESIYENLRTNNSYFVDAVGKYKKDWIRTTIIVVERDEVGNVARAVFSFQEIGDIIEQQKKIEEAKICEIHAMEMKELFIQTAEALVGAIDAKDRYTHGHSLRVATYAKQIATLSGLSESECEKVYFAGLLHDVGKIGIPDTIINKAGKLTDEEYNEIKQHPVSGKEILKRISRLPYLSIGANYHHEQYDGTGYPEGLRGQEIPRIARIIAVADAYDAMTSKRSYRNPIPQQIVREEIVMGMETQFDPDFAKVMIHLIDRDIEYQMKENMEYEEDKDKSELLCEAHGVSHLKAVLINENEVTIRFKFDPINEQKPMPAFFFFDSLDTCIHEDDNFTEKMFYHRYGELKADGSYVFDGVRKTEFETESFSAFDEGMECKIEIVKEKDHMYLKMQCFGQNTIGTVALPNSTRFVYMALTGGNCYIHDIQIDRDKNAIKEGKIQRIAEEITYLSGKEGNIPSVQVDGVRSATTEGIILDGNKEITFDMKSLPFARLIWHCPFIVVYYSKDGTVYGEDYREYSLMRLDGECWAGTELSTNNSIVAKTEEFPGWKEWKQDNKRGRHCNVSIQREDNQVVIDTVNGGVHIKNEILIQNEFDTVYLAFTGDQCVIENINVK